MILSALIAQGGQLSLNLQLVNIPLLIVVMSFELVTDTPFNLGSFSSLKTPSFLNLISISLAE